MPTDVRGVLRTLGLIVRLPGRLPIRTIDGLKAQNGVGPLNRFQRGAVHSFVWLCTLIVFSMAINRTPPAATTSTAASTPTTTVTTTVTAPATTPSSMSMPSQGLAAPDGERAMVATVIDGDTFQLTDGRKVRVLGIDSCEDTGKNKTPGGAQATTQAGVLDDNQVILTADPGVDVDKLGAPAALRVDR